MSERSLYEMWWLCIRAPTPQPMIRLNTLWDPKTVHTMRGFPLIYSLYYLYLHRNWIKFLGKIKFLLNITHKGETHYERERERENSVLIILVYFTLIIKYIFKYKACVWKALHYSRDKYKTTANTRDVCMKSAFNANTNLDNNV